MLCWLPRRIGCQHPPVPEGVSACLFPACVVLRRFVSSLQVRQTPGMEIIMKEIERKRKADEESGVKRKTYSMGEVYKPTAEDVEDVAEFWALVGCYMPTVTSFVKFSLETSFPCRTRR